MDKRKALEQVSKSLGVPVEWLDSLIKFESGWNPQAKNELSSARGLIQFTDSTAQSLGYNSSAELVQKNPTAEAQLLFPVLQYLSRFKPFPTKQALYMAVFYPAAKNWNTEKKFPQAVQNVNPGIVTVKDYVKKVDGSGSSNVLLYALALLSIYGITKLT